MRKKSLIETIIPDLRMRVVMVNLLEEIIAFILVISGKVLLGIMHFSTFLIQTKKPVIARIGKLLMIIPRYYFIFDLVFSLNLRKNLIMMLKVEE
jgi:hypothetical protein